MPTIRESIQSLRGLLEQPVQRGSAPGTAPVQTPDPAKKPKEPEKGKKKTKFRVGKQGEGEVTEAADAPDLPPLPFIDKELDARLTEIQKRWLAAAHAMSEVQKAMEALVKPVEKGYWDLDAAHSKQLHDTDEGPSDDLYDTLHAYHAIFATLEDIIKHFKDRDRDFADIASWFEPQTARKAPTSGAPSDLRGM